MQGNQFRHEKLSGQGDELEQLRRDAITSLDRVLAKLIELVQVAPVVPASETTHSRFIAQVMLEVFKNDLRTHIPLQDAGWRTIHGFHSYCNRAYPHWASKDTFYKRMNTCLPYLSSQGSTERRSVKKRHGSSRAKFEYRINLDDPYAKDIAKSLGKSS